MSYQDIQRKIAIRGSVPVTGPFEWCQLVLHLSINHSWPALPLIPRTSYTKQLIYNWARSQPIERDVTYVDVTCATCSLFNKDLGKPNIRLPWSTILLNKFKAGNSNSMDISFDIIQLLDIHQIATNICTCHDSTAVVTCAKFCCDHFIRIEVRELRLETISE